MCTSMILTGCGNTTTALNEISTTEVTRVDSLESLTEQAVNHYGEDFNAVELQSSDTMDYEYATKMTKFDLDSKDSKPEELEIKLYDFDFSQSDDEPVEILQEIVENNIKKVTEDISYYTSGSDETEVYGQAGVLGSNSVVEIYQDKDCYVRVTQYIDSVGKPHVLKISFKSDNLDSFGVVSANVEKAVAKEVGEKSLGLVRSDNVDGEKDIFDGKVVLSEQYFNEDLTVSVYALDVREDEKETEDDLLDKVQKLVRKEYTNNKKDMHIFTSEDKKSAKDKWGNADILSDNTRVGIVKNKSCKYDMFIREDGMPMVLVVKWSSDKDMLEGLALSARAEQFYYDSLYY